MDAEKVGSLFMIAIDLGEAGGWLGRFKEFFGQIVGFDETGGAEDGSSFDAVSQWNVMGSSPSSRATPYPKCPRWS